MSWPVRRSPMRARAVSPVAGVAIDPRTRFAFAKDDVVEYSTVRRDGRSACAQMIAPSRPVGPAATPASMSGRLRSAVMMPGAWPTFAKATVGRPAFAKAAEGRLATPASPPSWRKNLRLEGVLEAKLHDAAIFG